MAEAKTILLIEDDPNQVRLIERMLKKANLVEDTLVAYNGKQALDILYERLKAVEVKLPEIILLDLLLPAVSGLDVLKTIKANPVTELIPVIVLTALAEHEAMTECYQWGASRYIRKPVYRSELLAAIHYCLSLKKIDLTKLTTRLM